ncbi:ATP-binding protein [Sphingobacterium faecium]|uniref:ATP-binding protein n=1 Tax=Sphingobacterium faecium TaxID=34087 RepID=UPI003207DFFA
MTKFQIDLNVGNRFWTPKGLGAMGMEPTQALAELVANSLDWRIEDDNIKPLIQIIISKNSIEVKDNGFGMKSDELQNAIQVSVANENLRTSLRVRKGMFGMGMKVACLSLGWKITFHTRSKLEEGIENTFILNTRELDSDGITNNYRKNINGESLPNLLDSPLGDWKSGTSILIEDLSHRPLTAIAVRDSLQEIFSPEISVENVHIQVIDKISGHEYDCKKIDVPVYSESIINLDELNLFIDDETTGNPVQIKGWLGLMKTSSSGLGKWGLHLFKNNQVIERFHQLPSRLGGLMPKNPHPKFGRTYGEIHLDMCVPSFHKVGFDYSKKSWIKVAEILESSIATIMQASEEFKSGDHEKVKETIKKVQKNKKAIKKVLSNIISGSKEKLEVPENAVILTTGEWFIIVNPIIDKLGENERNKPWIYHFRKQSRELAIIINEESPIHKNLINGNSDDNTISLLLSWAISDCILLLLCEEFDYKLKDAVAFRDEQLIWLTSQKGGSNE